MAEGSKVTAEVKFDSVQLISKYLLEYVNQGSVPGGTNRNWGSYGHKVKFYNEINAEMHKNILADPQTSGGLLISVSKDGLTSVVEILKQHGLENFIEPIGTMKKVLSHSVEVN
jgi:selenide,water dikinase